MRNLKIVGIAAALVASAVVGGTLINAVAASNTPSTASGPASVIATDTDPGQYCQTFLNEFAKQLGVSESALLPAAKAAADAAIDQAVKNGDLTQALADQLKQRIANANGNGCAMLGARFGGLLKNVVRHDFVADVAQAAANALHISVADLRTKLASGQSLKQIAADQKVDYGTVTTAVHNALKADLDKLVSAGKLTAAQETAILDRVDQALQTGKLGLSRGLHLGWGMRNGFGLGFGPFHMNLPASPAPSASGSSS